MTNAYQNLFEILSDKEIYRTCSVAEFYCDREADPDPEKINVILRIDVDTGFHLSVPLAETLSSYGLPATFYFLTHPERYYNIWGSAIPKMVAELGHEVGLHSDHYYEQLTRGIDGLSKLKADIERLGEQAGTKVRGMVYHGHPEINAMGKTNWELTKDLPSSALNLDYHDGLLSCYIKPGSKAWAPKCDIRISDFMGISRSWGWNYYPTYPLRRLDEAKPGDIVHIAFHTKNAFRYWQGWDTTFGEKPIPKEPARLFWYKKIRILFRYNVRPVLRDLIKNILDR